MLNESFGGNPFPDTSNDPITLADDAAIAAGVTVVASTGDAGTNGTIGSPAAPARCHRRRRAPRTFRSYLQTDRRRLAAEQRHLAQQQHLRAVSSGGITQPGRVPDLVAPGDLGWALCTPDLELVRGVLGRQRQRRRRSRTSAAPASPRR